MSELPRQTLNGGMSGTVDVKSRPFLVVLMPPPGGPRAITVTFARRPRTMG